MGNSDVHGKNATNDTKTRFMRETEGRITMNNVPYGS